MTPVRFWYRAEALAIAGRHGLDPELVIAVCLHESIDYVTKQRGVACAFRHEPGFWLRYMAHKPEWDGAVPMRVSSSYGLMQVMFTTALDHGFPRKDPPEMLFVPTINLEYGCRVLASCMAWAKGDTAAALAAYNGGKTADNGPGVPKKRNQVYVDSVLLWLARVRAGEVTG